MGRSRDNLLHTNTTVLHNVALRALHNRCSTTQWWVSGSPL